MKDKSDASIAGDPMDVLLDGMVTGDASGAIERQEAEGQRRLQAASQLPRKGAYETEHGDTPLLRQRVEALGIRFGPIVDELFIAVTLPTGWHLEPTGHAMWSKLFDDQGHERARIFYKAAFYDRRAHVRWTARYEVYRWNEEWPTPEPEGRTDPTTGERHFAPDSPLITYVVRDRREGQVIHAEPPVVNPYGGEGDWLEKYDVEHASQRAAHEWLLAHFPQADDPFAYWSDGESDAYHRLAEEYDQRPTVPRGGGVKGEINPA